MFTHPQLLRQKAFGARVRLARRSAAMSQTALAEMAGISQPHVSRLEAGKRLRGLKPVTVIALAKALDVPALALVHGTDLQGLVMDSREEEEPYMAFCCNPLCDTNRIIPEGDSWSLAFDSKKIYSEKVWLQTNYCGSCGEKLVKACPRCGRRVGTRCEFYCRQCRKRLGDHPTMKDLRQVREMLGLDPLGPEEE